MASYKFVVFTNPAEGRESEYNRWYDEIHLGEVIALPGFTGAKRFKLRPQGKAPVKHRYMAIYEIETNDIDATMQGMFEHASTGKFNMSDALDSEIQTLLYEEHVAEPVA